MDPHLALIDARVAEAAEAWLNDPRDAGVYARLVVAVRARRRYLDGAVGPVAAESVDTEPVETEPVETEPVDTEPVETEPADAATDTGDPDAAGTQQEEALEPVWPAVRSVGSDLAGDPAAVLRRLRGG